MGMQQTKAARLDDDRERTLIGGALVEAAKGNPLMRAWVKAALDQHVTGEDDRGLLRAKGWL